jgi:hypothetical protein
MKATQKLHDRAQSLWLDHGGCASVSRLITEASVEEELLARIGAARHAVAPYFACSWRAGSGCLPAAVNTPAKYRHAVCAGLLSQNTGHTDLERTSRRRNHSQGQLCT